MTTYESDIKTISSNEEVVFGILSDLNNLKQLQDNPSLADKVKDLQFVLILQSVVFIAFFLTFVSNDDTQSNND